MWFLLEIAETEQIPDARSGLTTLVFSGFTVRKTSRAMSFDRERARGRSQTRKAGAPLNIVDQIVQQLTTKMQEGRLDVASLSIHRIAVNRISTIFPNSLMPIIVPITQERTMKDITADAERPSLSFPAFSFLGQFKDILDDHFFSHVQNLVVNPKNRWEHYKSNSCPHIQHEIQDRDWFQAIVEHMKSNLFLLESRTLYLGFRGMLIKLVLIPNKELQWNHFCSPWQAFPTTFIILQDIGGFFHSYLCPFCRLKRRNTFLELLYIAFRGAIDELVELQNNPSIVRLRLRNEFQLVRARIFYKHDCRWHGKWAAGWKDPKYNIFATSF